MSLDVIQHQIVPPLELNVLPTPVCVLVPTSIMDNYVKKVSVSVCIVFGLFYGPVNPMGSCRVWSVYLTILLLGRLSPLSG